MAEQNIGIRVLVLGVATASRQISSVRNDLSRFSNEVNKSRTTITSFAKDLNQVGAAMASLGRTLTISVTAPVLASTGALLKAGTDFETAFAGVARTSEGIARGFKDVAEEMYGTSKGLTQLQKEAVFASDAIADLTDDGKRLRQAFIDMSLEIPISAVELANVGTVAGQLGITGTENIERFTETITKFGVATGISSDSAAESIARIGNIMGISSGEMTQFAQQAGDAIVHLGNTAASTETEIINLSYRIAGAGRAVGLTTPEILGLSSALASAGIRAELGGSSINRILTTMSFALNDYSAAAETFSSNTEQVESDLAHLQQLLSSGMSWDAVERAMAGSSLNLDGLSSKFKSLGTDVVSLGDIVERVRLRSLTKLEEAFAAGRIEADEYQQKLRGIYDDVDRFGAAINSGITDIDELNYMFAGTDLVLTNISNDLNNLGKGVTSVGDVIDEVRRQTLGQLNKDLAESQDQFTLFAKIAGMGVNEFAQVVRTEPVRALQLVLAGLTRLQEEGKLSSDVLNDLELNTIRLKDVMLRLGPNQQLITDNINNANQAWTEGIALEEEFAKQSKTVNNQLQLLRNSFNALGIKLFDIVRDDISNLIKGVRGIVDRIRELDPAVLKTALRFGLIAASIGPALIAFGTLIQLTSIAIGGFATLGNLFKTFIALPLSPFGIIGTFLFGKKNKFGVRTGGLLSKFNLKGLAGSAQSVLGSVLGIFNLKGGIIAQLARPLTSGIQAVFRTAFGFLSKGVGVGVGLGGQLVSFLSNFLLTGVKTVISSIASMFLGPGAGFLTSSLFGIINVPITMLKTALRSAASLVGPFASVVVGAIKLPFGLLGDMIGGLLHSVPVLGGFIGKFLIGTLGKLPLILTGVGVALTAIFAPKVISQTVKNWNAVLQQLKLGFTSFVRDIKDEGLEKAILLFTSGGSTGSGRLGGIFGIAVALGASVDHARQFSYAIGTASYWVIQIVKGFFNVISSLKYVVSGTKRVEDATGGTATRLISFAEFLAKLFEGIYHGLMNTFHLFSAGMENLVDGVRAALSGIGKLFDVIFGKAEDDIQDTYTALAVGTDSPALSLGEKIGEIINTIIYFVTTGLGAIGQLVGAIATFFADIIAAYKEKGVRGVLEEIGEKAKFIWNGIVTTLGDLWDRAKPHLETFKTTAVNWLINTGAPAIASAAVSLATGITSAFKTALFGSNKEVQVGTRAIQNTLASNRKEFFIPLTGGIPQEALDTILSIGEQNFTFEPVYEQDTGIIGQIRTLVSDIKAVLTSEETKTQISEGFSNAWNSLTTWIETEAWPETEPTLRDWVNQIIDWFNNTALPKFKEIGSSIGEWLLDGLKSSVADMITPDFLGELKKGQFGDATVDFLRFIIGYKTADKIIKPLIDDIADSGADRDARSIGEKIMGALFQGLYAIGADDEQVTRIYTNMEAVARGMDNVFTRYFGIDSPSRLMTQHGADIIQGLINGLYNSMGGLSNVISRITYMFDTLRFGITNNLSGALSALSNFGMQASALINNATSVISNGINSVANMISNLTNTVKTMPSTVNSGGLSLLPGSGMTVTYVPQPVTSGVTNTTTSYTYSPTFASTPDRATRDANTTLYNVWKYSPKAVG